MKKYSAICVCLLLVGVWLPGCKKDDVAAPIAGLAVQTPEGGFVTDRYKLLPLLLTTTGVDYPFYEWKVDGVVASNDRDFYFVSNTEGKHQVTVAVRTSVEAFYDTLEVQVNKEKSTYSSRVARVFEYVPAPGQFVNTLPVFDSGENVAKVTERAETALKNNSLIHLGAFGGYVVMGFDHTIVNVSGQYSFKVLGNAFLNWSEPGIVMVSRDANRNGKPDDEWFEIAGSEYNSAKTIKNYEITYYKPDENKIPTPKPAASQTDSSYIRWTDNQGRTGYVAKNSFHKQSYYPQWLGKTLTFRGTRLTNEGVVDLSGSGTYFVSPAFEYGYADNWSNADARIGIKLDWAVTQKGKPVKLTGIDFIKVYTGMLGDAGWLGEVSTEIGGVEDLNLK